jgi:hypothetical protein
MRGSVPTRPVTARLTQATGVAATRNGSRPPIDVRNRSDQLPTTSGSHSARTPSMAISPPMTIDESRNSLAATGT